MLAQGGTLPHIVRTKEVAARPSSGSEETQMTGLVPVWLTIPVSASLVSIANSGIHMMSPWHKRQIISNAVSS